MSAVEVALLHRVADARPDDPAWLRSITLAPEEFERALAARRDAPRCPPDRLPLVANAPTDPIAGTAAKDAVADALLVTFDDAWRSVRDAALPALERHGVPAIVFVATGFVDGDWPPYERELARFLAGRREVRLAAGHVHALPDAGAREALFRRLREDWKPRHPDERRRRLDALRAANGDATASPADGEERDFLSWDEIVELARHPLITIGAHSWRHPQMNALRPWSAARELLHCRRALRRRLAQPIDWLAWPYGAHGGVARGLARAAGFRGAFSTRPGRVDGTGDRFALPRIEWSAA